MIIIVKPEDEANLKIRDIFDPVAVKEVMSRLQVVRDLAYEELKKATTDQLTYRPKPEKWSAIEQLRHLIFAEDLYLNRWILQNNRPWTQVGLLPDFWKNNNQFSEVGKEPSEDLSHILSAWSNLHEDTNNFVTGVSSEMLKKDTSDVDCGQGTVGAILQQLANHDFWHLNKLQLSINAKENT